jgi:hypothetical protein
MANILEKYGIKEVADVMFYEIADDGGPGAPVLYLDTLKVSTIEQTAEEAEARGGKGNPPLIVWDYGKEITVTLEDALFSAKSMAIMFGNGTVDSTLTQITKTIQFTGSSVPTKFEGPQGKEYAVPTTGVSYYDATGSTVATGSMTSDSAYFATFQMPIKNNSVIEISGNTFPGTYYITGDTYSRKESSGVDEFFQFIIPKAKVQSENTITLEAEGDPSVFNMNLRVLRPADGKMMKLVKYDMTEIAPAG